jgi:H2-forming N5,N10-methylenetetrahydromethanopterin dehydrogenase-like enzyme
MDTGYSTLRNLLVLVLVLVLVAILSNFYVASQLANNSNELAQMRLLLQKQLMGTALTQSEELQKRMDALNQSAAGIDAKMQKAQDDFVARMQVELPKIMDNYVKSRATPLEKQLQQRGLPIPR